MLLRWNVSQTGLLLLLHFSFTRFFYLHSHSSAVFVPFLVMTLLFNVITFLLLLRYCLSYFIYFVLLYCPVYRSFINMNWNHTICKILFHGIIIQYFNWSVSVFNIQYTCAGLTTFVTPFIQFPPWSQSFR